MEIQDILLSMKTIVVVVEAINLIGELMGMMKRFLEKVSVEIGQNGEITGAVIKEANKRLSLKKEAKSSSSN